MIATAAVNFTTNMDVNLTAFDLLNETSSSELAMLYHPCHPANPDFNCTRDDFLVFNRGPQTLQLSIVLPVSEFKIECLNVYLCNNIVAIEYFYV